MGINAEYMGAVDVLIIVDKVNFQIRPK